MVVLQKFHREYINQTILSYFFLKRKVLFYWIKLVL